MQKSTPKVLITNTTIPKGAYNILEKCFEIITVNKNTREEILDKVSGVDAIFWATYEKLDVEILDKAGPQLKVVATMSVGYNHIDVDELKKRKIKLGYTPDVLNDSVADLAILLALAASRRLHESRLAIERGEWCGDFDSYWMGGYDIEGSVVGIVGLGRIGYEVARRIYRFKPSKIIYTGHKEKPEGRKLDAEFVPFEYLVENSDFIFVICPLTPETALMFNKEQFSKMKNNAVFINVSRGGIVDQDALIEALKTRRIFGAGVDVTTPEPLPRDHELLKLPNCIVMPHLGSATFKTRNTMAELTANNILKGFHGLEMPAAVFY